MTTGCCEFLDFLRAEIERHCAVSIANAVIAEIQANFGAERVYVAAPPDDRRQEGMRMLRDGATPEQVAGRLRVHLSTAHRWRQRLRHPQRAGLGRSDWVL